MAQRNRTVWTVYPLETSQNWPQSASWPTTAWQPRVDVCETREGFHFDVEIPGVAESELSLHHEAGTLIIEGARRARELPTPRRCLQVEIERGTFRRSIALPPDADASRIEASLQNGVLQILVPRKTKTAETNIKIEIK